MSQIQLKAAARLNQVNAGSWGYGPLDTDGSSDAQGAFFTKIFAVCKKEEDKALKQKADSNFANIMPSWIGILCGLMSMNFPIDKKAWVVKVKAELDSLKDEYEDEDEDVDKKVLASFEKLIADVKSYKQIKHKFGILEYDVHYDLSGD